MVQPGVSTKAVSLSVQTEGVGLFEVFSHGETAPRDLTRPHHCETALDHAAATKSSLEYQRLGDSISHNLLWVMVGAGRP
jgi:hypothetical protein